MADNVLSSLFLSIAEAIRSKNGETGVLYSPAEFPGKIEKLDVSGGGSGESELVIASGEFTPSAAQVKIQHNLGVMPDVFAIFATATGMLSGTVNASGQMVASCGVSTKVKEDGGMNFGCSVFSISQTMVVSQNLAYGIDDATNMSGKLRNATATTIDVGSADGVGALITNKKYNWFAIGRKS